MTTPSPDGSRTPHFDISQAERNELGRLAMRELHAQFRQEDAWIMAGRPASGLPGINPITASHNRFIAEIMARNAASAAAVAAASAPRRKRRCWNAFAP